MKPDSLVQAQEVDAEFFCQLPSDSETLVDWLINGTYLRNLDTSNGLIRLEGRDGANEVLVIAAIPQYNNTVIACIAFYVWPNGSSAVTQSPAYTLIVQGTFNFSA